MNADFVLIRDSVLEDEVLSRLPTSDEIAARWLCQNLHYAGFAYTDFGVAKRILKFYAQSFLGVVDGVEMDFEGRKAAAETRESNKERKTRHVASNYLFRLVDSNSACAISIVSLYLEDDCTTVGVTPLVLADCAERYVKEEGIWRISYRYLEPVAGAPR
ncbi:hypothetical protein GCM10007242_27740 [Pigmentiphaga litoralis]|uniref:nuclear transport factor 2 family protein n=1 Tax=Pigmentiphaga litoralis TaxID=516702 RepID=UPI0016738CEC|nr:nuclear transport factor 2 family protein [Pigmentiphaga litoralis]GGX19342.1 hypothetical protein GCM10007242_27740 [Pigmentiphaga litoralis]